MPDGGGLVTFAPTPEDEMELQKFDTPGPDGSRYVGHPPNQFWFCEEHYPAAQALRHLTRTEALPKLRAQFSSNK
jgi:hypothetical protein